MSRLDGYIRVSRRLGREGESYISPDVQREAIQRWADYKGVEIAEWHFDEDWSGGTHDRPGLERAIERSVAGEAGGIVSWKIDRFSRYTEHGLRDLRLLDDANARLAFVTEDIDTSGPMGKYVYTMMLATAEFFLEGIKASWITAKTRAIERGVKIGPTPLGYERIDGSTLVPSAQAPLVAEAFRQAAGGDLEPAVIYLRRVIPERTWSASTVRRLLANRCYLGEARYGELVKPDAHEAIVTRAAWEAAQDGHVVRRRSGEPFPLSGIATCASCGGHMVGARQGRMVRTYRCSNAIGLNRSCDEGAIMSAHLLEDYCVRTLRDEWDGTSWTVGAPEDTALAQRALEDAETELQAFGSDLTLRRALGDSYHAHLQERVQAVDEARQEFRKLASESESAVSRTTLEDVLSTADPDEMRSVLASAFEAIVVRKGRGTPAQRVRLVARGGHELSGVASAQ